MTAKITTVNWDIVFYLSAFNSSWYVEQFLRYTQISDEKLPFVKILENKLGMGQSEWLSRRKCQKNKNRNFLISTSNHYRYTQFTSRYMFLMMTNTVLLVKNSLHIEKDFKSHDGRQFWPTKSLSVWNILMCQCQYCLKQKVLKFFVYL